MEGRLFGQVGAIISQGLSTWEAWVRWPKKATVDGGEQSHGGLRLHPVYPPTLRAKSIAETLKKGTSTAAPARFEVPGEAFGYNPAGHTGPRSGEDVRLGPQGIRCGLC